MSRIVYCGCIASDLTMTATTSFPTTRHPRQRLLVYARYPELGRVKTRLARELGPEATLELYRAMVDDLFDRLGQSTDETAIEVGWTGGDDVAGRELRSTFREHELFQQTGATLGDRLVVAFTERIFFHQATKIIAIGTDDPSLPRELIDAAFNLLDSCEYVIGPANDGGYYLIGARAGTFRTALFQDISWGEATVYNETLAKIRAFNATVAVLPVRRDIDDLASLEAFLQSSAVTPRLATIAKRLELLR
jgi:rSAM/selenodomain-associated transferase 1